MHQAYRVFSESFVLLKFYIHYNTIYYKLEFMKIIDIWKYFIVKTKQ